VGQVVSGPPLVGTAAGAATASHAAAALPGGRCESSYVSDGVVGGSARVYVNGRKVRAVRGARPALYLGSSALRAAGFGS
jgi:hypothetical protein